MILVPLRLILARAGPALTRILGPRVAKLGSTIGVAFAIDQVFRVIASPRRAGASELNSFDPQLDDLTRVERLIPEVTNNNDPREVAAMIAEWLIAHAPNVRRSGVIVNDPEVAAALAVIFQRYPHFQRGAMNLESTRELPPVKTTHLRPSFRNLVSRDSRAAEQGKGRVYGQSPIAPDMRHYEAFLRLCEQNNIHPDDLFQYEGAQGDLSIRAHAYPD